MPLAARPAPSNRYTPHGSYGSQSYPLANFWRHVGCLDGLDKLSYFNVFCGNSYGHKSVQHFRLYGFDYITLPQPIINQAIQ